MGKFSKEQKLPQKQLKKYIQLGTLAVAVTLLAVMPMLASRNQEPEDTGASILSATAERKTIDTQIIGGGQLSSEASLNVRIPENVKLTEYLVGNGDTVKEGEAIAKVDKISVMTAITEVQETLDYLAEKIADASDDTASTSVKALAGGTVKVIYAKEGESVQDVMLDHGALAVLSLDDVMAVKIQQESTLDAGDTVCVTFSDGTEVDGRIKTNLEGVLTVIMDDDDYSVGEKVTVSTVDGGKLGSGELYIFSPWSATAYSGRVDNTLVEENASVYIGQTMFSLEDTGNSAQFQRLIDQRQEYEELMQELFTMYRTETITAPCDGIVTGVDEDGAYLLGDNGDGWFVNRMSFFEKESDTGFVAYAVQVTEASEGRLGLMVDPEVICIPDMSALSAVSVNFSAMTEKLDYSGDIVVYTQNGNGLLRNAGTAKAGDVLLAVGDEEQIQWFVILNGSNEAAQVVQDKNQDNGIRVSLLSDEETPVDTCTGDESCMASNHNDGCPMIIAFLNTCTGNDDCQADTHEEECPKKNSATPSCTGEADCTYAPHNDNCKSKCDLSEDCPATNHKDGCESQKTSGTVPEQPTIRIVTSVLNQGVVGQIYTSALQATDGTTILTGTWAASGLPAGLTIDPNTGTISGTPEAAGSDSVTVSFTYREVPVVKEFALTVVERPAETETYLGYVAQVTEIADGTMKVKQTMYTYTVTDLNNLPIVSIDANALTQEATYVSSLITELSAAVNDYLLIVVEQDGTLKHFVKQEAPASGNQGGAPGGESGEEQGGGPAGSGTPSGGGEVTAGGGMAQIQTFEPYSLNKLAVASVTSQEHMTVSVTIDELDITKIYVGQAAVVSIDALGGEQFDAQITEISNSGENDGGNSKFTVEVTLGKSGDMLPGMYSSVFITLASEENVPCVPVAALGKEGVDSVLYTAYDAESGTLGNPVVVTIGASDGEYVELLDGFAVGETCYYEYYDTYVGSDMPRQQGRSFNLGRMLGGR